MQAGFTVLPRLILALTIGVFICSAQAQQVLSFSAEQVAAGKSLYQETCQICHGSSLANGQFGTPLKGSYFKKQWKGKSVGELMQFVVEKMPPDNLNSLTPAQYTAAVTYILSRNDIAPGEQALPESWQDGLAIALPWE